MIHPAWATHIVRTAPSMPDTVRWQVSGYGLERTRYTRTYRASIDIGRCTRTGYSMRARVVGDYAR
jgi:hypothetical protein